ncbi:MAG TPA: hypothetical protein VG674_16300 [Amycolatopsis sp.]|nr:hypothetical protein [Amycolatopsis sp.]
MSIPGVYGQPRGLKQARIVMWVQVVFSVLGSIFLLVLAGAASSADDASGVGGLLVVAGVVNVVLAVALGVCAAQLASGRPWAWVTAIVVEAVIMINALVSLITAGATGVLPMVLAAAALGGLLSKEMRAWAAANRAGRADPGRATA